jgi:hypothetical protein
MRSEFVNERGGKPRLNAGFADSKLVQSMQTTETIQCPFCGQSFELVIDTSVASQRFTTDCEVCCRPSEVSVECESGEVISVDVQGN